MTDTIEQLRNDPRQRSAVLRKAAVLASGIVGGIAARRAMNAIWTRAGSPAKPPLTPDDPAVSWRQALGWAVSSGLGAGVARLVARRLAAGAVNPA